MRTAGRRLTPDQRVAALLFLGLSLLYLSTAHGVLQYLDDVAMLQVTQALVERGDVDVPYRTPGSDQAQPQAKPEDRHYSKYGIGQSLLAIPFYIAGRELERVIPARVIIGTEGFPRSGTRIYTVMMLGILSTGATVALLYLTCRALDFSHLGSLAAAAGLGLGTFAWHYARTFMTEPTSMFSCFLAFYALLRFILGGRKGWLVVSGAAAGIALLLRLSNVVVIAPLGLWLVAGTRYSKSNQLRGMLTSVLAWTVPITLAVALVAAYNFVRFAKVQESGYGDEAYMFTTPVQVGLYGLILSPGKGLFFYAPIVLAGMAGWVRRGRVQPILTAVVWMIIATYVLYYARYYLWFGGGVWGPRFLVVILPFFMIGLAALVDQGMTKRGKVLLASLGLLSFLVQILSILVPYTRYLIAMGASPRTTQALLWDPASSPILAHARALLRWSDALDLAPIYYRSPELAWLQLGAAVGSVLAITGAVLLARRADRVGGTQTGCCPAR